MRLLVIFFSLFFCGSVVSHNWYPMECCDKRDCDEIIDIIPLHKNEFEVNPNTFIVVTKRAWALWYKGKVQINKTPSGREMYPPDHKRHACIISTYGQYLSKFYKHNRKDLPDVPEGNLLCIFIPSGQ